EAHQSWALIKGGSWKDERWLARRTTWERSMDYERSTDPLKRAAFMVDSAPIPTIEVLDAPADAGFAAQFLERLAALTVPALLASDDIGIDGVVNGIETLDGQVHLERSPSLHARDCWIAPDSAQPAVCGRPGASVAALPRMGIRKRW